MDRISNTLVHKTDPICLFGPKLLACYTLKIGSFACLAGGFKYFLFSSLPGEMIQFDEHIFQMGWFNHKLVVIFAISN